MSNILIVGANQGIGYNMVVRLLEKGNKVTVLDIQNEHISELKDRYRGSLLIIRADATDEESLSEGIKEAIKEFGNIDIAIHNACLCTFTGEQDTDYEVYKKVMDVNYFVSDGTLWEVQTALYFRWTYLPDGAVPELAAGFSRNDRRLS